MGQKASVRTDLAIRTAAEGQKHACATASMSWCAVRKEARLVLSNMKTVTSTAASCGMTGETRAQEAPNRTVV